MNFKEEFILFYLQLISHSHVFSDGVTSAQRNAACMLIQVQFFSGCCLLSMVQWGDCSWGLGLNKASSTKPWLLLLLSHSPLCQGWQRPFRGCPGIPTAIWHANGIKDLSIPPQGGKIKAAVPRGALLPEQHPCISSGCWHCCAESNHPWSYVKDLKKATERKVLQDTIHLLKSNNRVS